MAFGADAAPLPDAQGTAEQIGPEFHAIGAPLIQSGTHTNKRGRFGEQRRPARRGQSGMYFVAFGMLFRKM